jgi:hypothetical protein
MLSRLQPSIERYREYTQRQKDEDRQHKEEQERKEAEKREALVLEQKKYAEEGNTSLFGMLSSPPCGSSSSCLPWANVGNRRAAACALRERGHQPTASALPLSCAHQVYSRAWYYRPLVRARARPQLLTCAPYPPITQGLRKLAYFEWRRPRTQQLIL